MSTSYTAQINNMTGKHTIQFETDDYDTLRRVEEACQREIDRLNNEEEQPKMTIQEAIEIITNAIQTENMTVEQDRALAIVQKAAGKQIPKQVKFSKCITCYSDTCEDCKDGVLDKCPTCNESLNNGSVEECDFCPYCGQSLDWSREWIE